MIDELVEGLLRAVEGVDPVTRTIIAGVAILLETSVLLGLVVPGDTIVLVASTAVRTPLEFGAMLTATIVGALIGESLGYAIGRWIGPWLRRSRLGRLVGEANWGRAETYLRQRGGVAIFLSRFLPVLHSLVPVTVGMSGFGYRRFLAWTAPACVVWATAYVTVGSVVAEGYRQLADRLHGAGYLFVAAIVLFIVVVLLIKRTLARGEARHWRGDRAPADDPATAIGHTED